MRNPILKSKDGQSLNLRMGKHCTPQILDATSTGHHKYWTPQILDTTNTRHHKYWTPQILDTTNTGPHKMTGQRSICGVQYLWCPVFVVSSICGVQYLRCPIFVVPNICGVKYSWFPVLSYVPSPGPLGPLLSYICSGLFFVKK